MGMEGLESWGLRGLEVRALFGLRGGAGEDEASQPAARKSPALWVGPSSLDELQPPPHLQARQPGPPAIPTTQPWPQLGFEVLDAHGPLQARAPTRAASDGTAGCVANPRGPRRGGLGPAPRVQGQ